MKAGTRKRLSFFSFPYFLRFDNSQLLLFSTKVGVGRQYKKMPKTCFIWRLYFVMQYPKLFLLISINVKFCPFLKMSVYKHFYSCNVSFIFLLTRSDCYYRIINFWQRWIQDNEMAVAVHDKNTGKKLFWVQRKKALDR